MDGGAGWNVVEGRKGVGSPFHLLETGSRESSPFVHEDEVALPDREPVEEDEKGESLLTLFVNQLSYDPFPNA